MGKHRYHGNGVRADCARHYATLLGNFDPACRPQPVPPEGVSLHVFVWEHSFLPQMFCGCMYTDPRDCLLGAAATGAIVVLSLLTATSTSRQAGALV
jgi:hypothetical protein